MHFLNTGIRPPGFDTVGHAVVPADASYLPLFMLFGILSISQEAAFLQEKRLIQPLEHFNFGKDKEGVN